MDLVFRAWHHNKHKMYQVLIMDFGLLANIPELIVTDGREVFTAPTGMFSVMQSTGKTDTLGNMIFDGDLCDYKGSVGEVRRDHDRLVLAHKEVSIYQEIGLWTINGKDLKVIGNIFEGIFDEKD